MFALFDRVVATWRLARSVQHLTFLSPSTPLTSKAGTVAVYLSSSWQFACSQSDSIIAYARTSLKTWNSCADHAAQRQRRQLETNRGGAQATLWLPRALRSALGIVRKVSKCGAAACGGEGRHPEESWDEKSSGRCPGLFVVR